MPGKFLASSPVYSSYKAMENVSFGYNVWRKFLEAQASHMKLTCSSASILPQKSLF